MIRVRPFILALAYAHIAMAQWSTGTGGQVYYNGGAVGIGDSSPATSSSLLKAGTGTNYNEGGQASRGATSRVFSLADGSSTTPVSTLTPSVVMQRVDSTSTSGTFIPFQYSIDKSSGSGFFYGWHYYLRSETPGASGQQTDLVPVTSSMYCNPSSAPVAQQNCYGSWISVDRTNAGANLWGMEMDINNTAGDSPFALNVGYPNAATTSGGIALYSSKHRNSVGIAINTGDNVGTFYRGIYFGNKTITGYGIGIDFSDADPANGPYFPLFLHNDTYIGAENAAGTQQVPVIGLDSSNNIVLGTPYSSIGGLTLLTSGATLMSVDSSGYMKLPTIKSTTGTRYVCVDTTGKLTSSATACSGT